VWQREPHEQTGSDRLVSDAAPLLALRNVTLAYSDAGRRVVATQDISLNVAQSDRIVLLGPSGCGKSTLLKAIGGFIPPESGTIQLAGVPITKPSRTR